MALPHVNAGELITSAAWNNMVDEFNTKVNKVGDGIIAGSLSINGLLKANKLEITDAATGVSFPDSWIGMANNIDGASKWLHIGGITDSGARRIALFASKSYFSGNVGIQTVNPADALDVAGGTRTRSLTFTMANNTGNGMSIVRSANTMDVSMGTAGFLLPNSPPLTYTFRVGHHGLLILGGGDSFVTKFSVD